MREQLALLPEYLTAHLQLTLVALAAGVAISVPVGVWAARRPRAERWVLGFAGVAQTIPGLALLAVMVPLLASLGGLSQSLFGLPLRSIGFLPAILALTVYSLLPILRNTVTGLAGVDPALVEAARAVGMTPRQQLRRVELPLAMPVIVAGLRTATVWVVGTATLSTPVGAPSLGNFIFSGLQTRNFAAVLVGCVAAAALALGLDFLIRKLELGFAERRRAAVAGAGAVLAALFFYAAATFAADLVRGASAGRVRIGCKTFTEQYVLAEIVAGQVARRAGTPAEVVSSLGSTVAFDALVAGEIDVYVDYSGTIWATLMKRADLGVGRRQVLDEVDRFLAERHGVELVGPLGFENAYALAMRRARARELGVATISDLAQVAGRLEMGGDFEIFSRAEWSSLVSVYGLRFRARRSMDPSLMYPAVANGEVDVISAFSSDGRIAALDLVLLEDDRRVIPPYDAILLAAGRLARERPQVRAALGELVGSIDQERVQRLNLAVDRDGRSPAEVARAFLAEAAGG